MTPAEIQTVLRESAGMTRTGYLTAPVRRVAEAGADVEAVERWVIDNGGQRRMIPAPESKGLRPGRFMAPARGAPTEVFEVPHAAFQGG